MENDTLRRSFERLREIDKLLNPTSRSGIEPVYEKDFVGYAEENPTSKIYWKGKLVDINDLDKVI